MTDNEKKLFDEEFLKGNSFIDPLASANTNNSFRAISNEIAKQSLFGKKSIFNREEREIIKGQIPKL